MMLDVGYAKSLWEILNREYPKRMWDAEEQISVRIGYAISNTPHVRYVPWIWRIFDNQHHHVDMWDIGYGRHWIFHMSDGILDIRHALHPRGTVDMGDIGYPTSNPDGYRFFKIPHPFGILSIQYLPKRYKVTDIQYHSWPGGILDIITSPNSWGDIRRAISHIFMRDFSYPKPHISIWKINIRIPNHTDPSAT